MGPWVWIVGGLAAVILWLMSRGTAEAAAPATSGINPNNFPNDIILPDNVTDLPQMNVQLDSRTRGERNNNPGNVKYNAADQWKGLVGHDDAGFCVFSDYSWGVRVIVLLMRRYYYDYQFDTVREIINRYAPPSENDTGSYVTNVCVNMGVLPDEQINIESDAVMLDLVRAIILQENGRVKYSTAQINYGISLA